VATRLYYINRVVASGFTPDASWEKTTGHVVRRMGPSKSSATASTSVSLASHGSVDADTLLAQFISEPLDVDQTITGTVKGQMRVQSGLAALDPRSQMVIRVIAPGGTVRGTLLAHDTSALTSEWSTSIVNRRMPLGGSVALTSVAGLAGDRIVAEPGIRQHAVGANNTALLYGGEAASDLPEDESTTTALANWLEFSQDITFTNESNVRVSRVTETGLIQKDLSALQARVSRVTLTALVKEPASPPATQVLWIG
jgi:hypothetical protein